MCRLDGDDDTNPSLAPLKKLKQLLVWEFHSLYMLVLLPIYFVHQTSAKMMAALGMILVIVVDTYFSINITKFFYSQSPECWMRGTGRRTIRKATEA
jgi:hypothetical protein